LRLLELLKQPEGKTLEFKRDLSSPDGVLRSIVALANTAGGILLVGVEDKSRHVRGVKDPLATEERLANLVSDNIMPRLAPELEILSWRRTHVLAVQVFPSPSRPHYLRAGGLENSAYVRVGSTNRRADSEMIAELRRFARGESFDEQPLAELDSEALDFRVASELFTPIRRLKPHDLETLKLIARHQGRKVRRSATSCSLAMSESATFQMHGYRPVDSNEMIGATSSYAFAERSQTVVETLGSIARRVQLRRNANELTRDTGKSS